MISHRSCETVLLAASTRFLSEINLIVTSECAIYVNVLDCTKTDSASPCTILPSDSVAPDETTRHAPCLGAFSNPLPLRPLLCSDASLKAVKTQLLLFLRRRLRVAPMEPPGWLCKKSSCL